MSDLLITSLLIIGGVILILIIVGNEFRKIEMQIAALSEENWVLRDYSSSILQQLTEYKYEVSSIKEEIRTKNKQPSNTWNDTGYEGYVFSESDSKEKMKKDAERRLHKWRERQQRRQKNRGETL